MDITYPSSGQIVSSILAGGATNNAVILCFQGITAFLFLCIPFYKKLIFIEKMNDCLCAAM